MVYKMGEVAGPQNVKSIPIYERNYNLPLPDGDNTRWQMIGEMFEIRTWSPVVADAITQDFAKDYVPGDRLSIVGNSGGGTIAIEALDLLEENGVYVDQVILRGFPVMEWNLSNVGRVDYIAANPPISDWKYYSVDINPFDNVNVPEHRAGFQGHTLPDTATRKQVGDLIADLMIR